MIFFSDHIKKDEHEHLTVRKGKVFTEGPKKNKASLVDLPGGFFRGCFVLDIQIRVLTYRALAY